MEKIRSLRRQGSRPAEAHKLFNTEMLELCVRIGGCVMNHTWSWKINLRQFLKPIWMLSDALWPVCTLGMLLG
jgi:hypothetical protein